MQHDTLILIRLASRESLSRDELVEDLLPLAGDGFMASLAGHLTKLEADGLLIAKPKSLHRTEPGRARAMEVLKVDAMPRWDVVLRRHLPDEGVEVVSNDELRATAIAEQVLLAFERGLHKTRQERLEELARIAVDILRTPPKKLRAKRRPATPPKPPLPPGDLVAAVHDAAARVPDTGRFGADRVFVSALWKQLDEGSGFPGLTLDGFKKRLLDANRKQQLTLARADMPGAMDRATVAASEIKHLNSTFHFVLDRSRQ